MTSMLLVNAVDLPGGAELCGLRLAQRLRDRGWDITVTTPSDDGPMTHLGYDHLKLDVGGLGAGEGARAVGSWPKALMLSRDYDVVYLNSGVCGRLLPAVRGGAKVVLHIHDLVDRVPRHWHRADVVLAPVQAVADRLEGLDAHVVRAPVEVDPPERPAPWRADPSRPGPVIGYVGRIEPDKGVLDLVQAAPRIQAEHPGARVVVVGGDPYGIDSDYLAAVRGAEGVESFGWVQDGPSVLRHLDVLVNPSHKEAFGTVCAEAMAVGTPVVATDVGGLPETVLDGVTGVVVPPRDPDALAAGVSRVLAQREAMSGAARTHAAQFSADAFADRVEVLLRP